MDPIIFSALGGLLANALSGIVGNRADAAVTSAWQAIVGSLKKGGKLVNHDLQRAILRSFILALRTICDDCINELKAEREVAPEDIRWLEEKRRSLDEELKRAEKAEYVEPPFQAFDEIQLLLLPDGSLAQERLQALKAALVRTAIGESEPPRCYKDKCDQLLFELMSAYFADQIKHNQAVRNVLEGQLLSEIKVRLQEQQLTVERILESLAAIGGARNQELAQELTLAFKLGYVLALYRRYSEAEKAGTLRGDISRAVEARGFQLAALARTLSIECDLKRSESIYYDIDTKRSTVKNAFRSGVDIRSGWFGVKYAVLLTAAGELSMQELDEARSKAAKTLQRAEDSLTEAGFASGILGPVREVWSALLGGSGKSEVIDHPMDEAVDRVCAMMEAGMIGHA